MMYIKSAKILLLPPKYEIIMVPSNHSFFSIARKVITLNPLCILFGISSLLNFLVTFLKLSLFQLLR